MSVCVYVCVCVCEYVCVCLCVCQLYPPTPADSRGSALEKQRPATSAMQCEGGAREDRRGSHLRDEGGENRRVAGEASRRSKVSGRG